VARASDDARDVDLALLLAAGSDGFAHAVQANIALERRLGVPVDVHDFDSLPLDLRFRVLDEGAVVVDRDPPERVDREVATMLAYYDFIPYLERIPAGSRARVAESADRG
jgi:hypothetical protein